MRPYAPGMRRRNVEVPAFGVHDRDGNTSAEGLKLR
jgi:hypothetical protein